MKISTKVEYGLVALIDIATNCVTSEVVTVISISERQGISKNYLEQILTPLRQAGLISGTKGAQGGYVLTKKPEELKLSTILNALDNNLLKVAFDSSMKCEPNVMDVLNEKAWSLMDEKINEIADKITLADLVQEYKNKLGNSVMFYI